MSAATSGPVGNPNNPARPVVLVVDDEDRLLAAVKRVLQLSFEVLTAGSANEALPIAMSRRVDLLLIDYRMPGWSGVELIERLRTYGVTSPAALLTASPEAPAVRDALRTGIVQAVVSKPWRAGLLLGQALQLLQAGVK